MRCVVAGTLVALSLTAAVVGQTAVPTNTPDLDFVGTLPDSCDLIIATGPLSGAQSSPAWRCVQQFATELTAWDRSVQAWAQVAASLEMTPAQAVNEILGGGVVVAVSGLSDTSREPVVKRALMCEVRPEIEARLRERLRPAPRALEGALPILALENGAFDLAARVRAGESRARVVVAPRGSDSLFDELLPVIAGTPAASPMRATRQWTHLTAMPPGAVMILYRDLNPPPARGGPVIMPGDRFIAASIVPGAGEVQADLVATRDFLLPAPREAFGDGLSDSIPAVWPTAAVEWAFRGSVLAVAGNPREQPPDIAMGLLGGGRTMLLSLLDSLKLPVGLGEPMDGVAIVTVHEAPAGVAGRSITAAIPVRDVTAFAPEADAWAVAFAGRPGLKTPGAQLDSIRVLAIEAAKSADEETKPGGTIAWSFARPPGGASGWWVLTVQLGMHDQARAAMSARDLAERLSVPMDGSAKTLYQLDLRPARLAKMTPADGSASVGAFRWVERVRTTLESAPNGLVKGTFTATFDTSLLEPK